MQRTEETFRGFNQTAEDDDDDDDDDFVFLSMIQPTSTCSLACNVCFLVKYCTDSFFKQKKCKYFWYLIINYFSLFFFSSFFFFVHFEFEDFKNVLYKQHFF